MSSLPHESFLAYRRRRYLWIAAGLALLCLLALWLDEPPFGVIRGDTPLGYVLGCIGAALILWLSWFGIRKRRYEHGRRPLSGWLSAHVYLGCALPVIVTAHSGLEFGPNVHLLAYLLTLACVLSGILGVLAYRRYPAMMTRNRGGLSIDEMLNQITGIDAECRTESMNLPDRVNQAVHRASHQTRIAGNLLQRMLPALQPCATRDALRVAQAEVQSIGAADSAALRRLIGLLTRKQTLLEKARSEIRMSTLLEIWLFAHVPLSVALLAALLLHVVSVHYYW